MRGETVQPPGNRDAQRPRTPGTIRAPHQSGVCELRNDGFVDCGGAVVARLAGDARGRLGESGRRPFPLLADVMGTRCGTVPTLVSSPTRT